MEEITSQEEEMKDLRQKLYDVEADINKVNYFFDHVTLTYRIYSCISRKILGKIRQFFFNSTYTRAIDRQSLIFSPITKTIFCY